MFSLSLSAAFVRREGERENKEKGAITLYSDLGGPVYCDCVWCRTLEGREGASESFAL